MMVHVIVNHSKKSGWSNRVFVNRYGHAMNLAILQPARRYNNSYLINWWKSTNSNNIRSKKTKNATETAITSSPVPSAPWLNSNSLVVLTQRGERKTKEFSNFISHLLINEGLGASSIQIIVPNYLKIGHLEAALQDAIPEDTNKFANVRIDSLRSCADFALDEFGNIANMPEKKFELRRASENIAFLSYHMDQLQLPELFKSKENAVKSLSLIAKYISSLRAAGISVNGYKELSKLGYDMLGLENTYEQIDKIKRSRGYFDNEDVINMALESIQTLKTRGYDLESHFYGRRYGKNTRINSRHAPKLIVLDDIHDYSPVAIKFLCEMLKLTQSPETRLLIFGNTDDNLRNKKGSSADNFTFLCGGDKTFKDIKKAVLHKFEMDINDIQKQSLAQVLSIKMLQTSNQDKKISEIKNWKDWGRYSNHFNDQDIEEYISKAAKQDMFKEILSMKSFFSKIDENRYVCKRVLEIKELTEMNQKKKSVLIATPSLQDAEILLNLLETEGLFSSTKRGSLDKNQVIGINSLKKIQLFKVPIVTFLHNYMKLLVFPQDDRSLYAVVTSQIAYKIGSGEISQIYAQSSASHLPFRTVLMNSNNPEIVRFFKELKTLEGLVASGLDSSQMLLEILNVTGLAESLIKGNTESDSRAAYYVNEFLSQINRGMISSRTSALPYLLEFLDLVIEAGGIYVDYSNHGEDFDEVPVDREFEDSHLLSLKVSTIKDIISNPYAETFDEIMVCNLSDNRYPSRRYSKNLPLSEEMLLTPREKDGFGSDGPFLVYEPLDRDDHIDEERANLAKLIACSRSKIYLSHFKNQSVANEEDAEEDAEAMLLKKGKRYCKPSRFMTEISSLTGVRIEDCKYIVDNDRDTIRNRGEQNENGDKDSTIESAKKDIELAISTQDVVNVNEKKYSLSFSRLLDIETCPKRYFLSRVMKVQTPSNPAMFLGKALHAAIAAHSSEPNPMKKFDLTSKTFLKHWDEAFGVGDSELNKGSNSKNRTSSFESVEGFKSIEHIENMKKEGFKKLANFIKRLPKPSADKQLPETLLVEQGFMFDHILPSGDTIGIVGFWDKVEKTWDGNITIVDYKTKIPEDMQNRKPEFADPKDRALKNWDLQLKFYAWAYQKVYGLIPNQLIIECISSGEKIQFKPFKSVEEIENILNPRFEAALKVMQGPEFVAKPSFLACKFCNYRKTCPEAFGA